METTAQVASSPCPDSSIYHCDSVIGSQFMPHQKTVHKSNSVLSVVHCVWSFYYTICSAKVSCNPYTLFGIGVQLSRTMHVYMTFSKKRFSSYPDTSIYISKNCPLLKVEEFKYLGVTLTSDLKWANHMHHLQKASQVLMPRRCQSYIT